MPHLACSVGERIQAASADTASPVPLENPRESGRSGPRGCTICPRSVDEAPQYLPRRRTEIVHRPRGVIAATAQPASPAGRAGVAGTAATSEGDGPTAAPARPTFGRAGPGARTHCTYRQHPVHLLHAPAAPTCASGGPAASTRWTSVRSRWTYCRRRCTYVREQWTYCHHALHLLSAPDAATAATPRTCK